VLWATEAELKHATEALARALCPDKFHDGPCATPWGMASSRVDDVEDQGEAGSLRALIEDQEPAAGRNLGDDLAI
jgi:hypothetical protein